MVAKSNQPKIKTVKISIKFEIQIQIFKSKLKSIQI